MKKVGYLAAVIIVLIWCMTRREFTDGPTGAGGARRRGPMGPARFHAMAYPNLPTCPVTPPYEM